jgi:hypothetical protein
MANKENIRKWVEALRSGKYKQGRGILRSVNDEFCCLGVACDVSQVAEWELCTTRFRYITTTNLPPEVQDWLGIDNDEVYLSLPDYEDNLTAVALNDRYRFAFDQISDAIEKTYLTD